MGDSIMKTLLIVRGLPGSGKSTFVNMMYSLLGYGPLEEPDGVQEPIHEAFTNCCADHYMGSDFDPSRLKECHTKCQEKAQAAMSVGCNLVVVSNTSTQEWEMNPYLEWAELYGYRVHSIIMENRHNGTSIHGVPEDKLEVMKQRFEVSL
jgi:hypothetical protein